MSPAFIMAIAKKFKCASCGRQKLTSYSVCNKHLLVARRAWRTMVVRKMILGQCVNCHYRHVAGEQRCRKHKEINRKRISNWSYNQYWARRRDGLCVDCPVGQAKLAAPDTCYCLEHRQEAILKNRAYRAAKKG